MRKERINLCFRKCFTSSIFENVPFFGRCTVQCCLLVLECAQIICAGNFCFTRVGYTQFVWSWFLEATFIGQKMEMPILPFVLFQLL